MGFYSPHPHNMPLARQPRTIIRITSNTLTFALPSADNPRSIQIAPYTVKSGMSMAVNMREALRDNPVLVETSPRAMVLVDTPVMHVPMDEYVAEESEAMYHHTFPGHHHDNILQYVIADLHCVAVFAVNKDLHMVLHDNFDDVRIMPLSANVWSHLHQRSYTGATRKLYAYFHDKHLEVISYANKRFRFFNVFDATEQADCVYFILYIWKQLALDSKRDELYLLGEYAEMESLRNELKQYVMCTYPINPSAEFNRAPVTRLSQATYDIVCLVEAEK